MPDFCGWLRILLLHPRIVLAKPDAHDPRHSLDATCMQMAIRTTRGQRRV